MHFFNFSKNKNMLKHDQSIYKEKNITNNCIQLVMQKKFREAYKLICKNNIESHEAVGLNIDWKQQYEIGLNPDLEAIFEKQIEYADSETDFILDDNKMFNSCIIMLFMLGKNPVKIFQIYDSVSKLELNTDEKNLLLERCVYQISMISEFSSWFSFIRDGVEKYDILCCNDSCSTCKKICSKTYNCEDAELGINFPPFHKKCRCSVVAHFDD